MKMELPVIISLLGCTFTIVAAIVMMFLWVRSEANNDRKDIYGIQREDRKELLQISKNIENIILAIQNEIRDFHNRLCKIEEGRK